MEISVLLRNIWGREKEREREQLTLIKIPGLVGYRIDCFSASKERVVTLLQIWRK